MAVNFKNKLGSMFTGFFFRSSESSFPVDTLHEWCSCGVFSVRRYVIMRRQAEEVLGSSLAKSRKA